MARRKQKKQSKQIKRLKERRAVRESVINVTAARKLTAAQEKRIHKIFGSEKEIQVEIDESILGGIIIETEDKYFDGSLTGQLKRLKRHILNS